MTPDERFALDLWAMQYDMDSDDVDAALATLNNPTPALARAAIAAYALRRDMTAGRAALALLPAARAVIEAWRAPVEPTPEGAAEHMRRLADALADLESALLLLDIDAIREE